MHNRRSGGTQNKLKQADSLLSQGSVHLATSCDSLSQKTTLRQANRPICVVPQAPSEPIQKLPATSPMSVSRDKLNDYNYEQEFLAMAELGKTQCESLIPRSCKNTGKYWIYRGDANRIVCPTHLARVMAEFTRPAVMWYPEYKVTDMSEVTIRVWNGTSWYPQISHVKGN